MMIMAWSSTPQRARWFGEVIFEDADGQTDYAYAYSAAPDEPDPEEILPAEMRDKILERTVKPTPNNEAWEPEPDDDLDPGYSAYSLLQAEQAIGEVITNGGDISAYLD